MDQFDDQLGHLVGRGRLAGKHHDARDHAVRRRLRVVQDLLVARDHVQHVQQLALVLVDALDLHVEQCAGVQLQALVLHHPARQALLVHLLGVAEGAQESRLVRHVAQRLQLRQIAPPAPPNALVQQRGQRRVGLGQPAPWRHAIGLVVEALGVDAGKVGKDGLLHQLRMQARHAIHRVAGHHRHIGHAHAPLARFVDQREPAHQFGVVAQLLGDAGQKVRIDVKNDLQMARQDAAQRFHRPGLQRLVHQRVVGVREHLLRITPGRGPGQMVFVQQQAHQLGNRQHRVGVVQVDADLFRQQLEAGVAAQVAPHQILQAGADEEVFLVQAQLSAGRRGVVRVQHARHVFGMVLALDRRHVVATVERRQIDLFGSPGRP